MENQHLYDQSCLIVDIYPAGSTRRKEREHLAVVNDGVDKVTMRQVQTPAGLKTTIEFISVGGDVLALNYDRAKERRKMAASRLGKVKAKKAEPA